MCSELQHLVELIIVHVPDGVAKTVHVQVWRRGVGPGDVAIYQKRVLWSSNASNACVGPGDVAIYQKRVPLARTRPMLFSSLICSIGFVVVTAHH